MKKLAGVALTLVLVLLVALAQAEPAKDISKQCKLTLDGKRFNATKMLDRKYTTYTKIAKGKGVVIDASEPLSGLFLQFFDRATPVAIQVEQDGAWVTVTEGGVHLTDWFALPAGTRRARVLNLSKSRLFLAELTVYGAGDRPANAASWHDCDKADLMLLAAHPDDELLWFGGLLPTYAGERGLNVQVVYAVKSTPQRRLELLDGLWHCGVTAYPAFLGFADARAKTKETMYRRWGKNKVFAGLTDVIRHYRPEVLVTQDFGGEYGHGAHRVVADAAVQCVGFAADASKYRDGEHSAPWQVKKLYIHLYDQHQVRMDWHIPLAAFGGKDSMTVATEALDCHASQVRNGWAMTEGGEMDNTLFGLYFTTVGPDERGDDLMEHIDGLEEVETYV